jgi:archaemetzincin
MNLIRIVSFGEVEASVLYYLGSVLYDHSGMECRVEEEPLDLSGAYLQNRHQHHSSRLLESLKAFGQMDGEWFLGLTEADLCIPILTFVFGEAILGGRAAVVSLHRLRAPFYGLPDDPDLLLRRAEKEALHELGHAAGLIHCPNYTCAMAFSNAVEQVDLKEAAFCEPCRGQLLTKWPKAPGRE